MNAKEYAKDINEAYAELAGNKVTFYDANNNKIAALKPEHHKIYKERIVPFLQKSPGTKKALAADNLDSYDFTILGNGKVKITGDDGKVLGMV